METERSHRKVVYFEYFSDLLDGGVVPQTDRFLFALKCGVGFGAVATVTSQLLSQNASLLAGGSVRC